MVVCVKTCVCMSDVCVRAVVFVCGVVVCFWLVEWRGWRRGGGKGVFVDVLGKKRRGGGGEEAGSLPRRSSRSLLECGSTRKERTTEFSSRCGG